MSSSEKKEEIINAIARIIVDNQVTGKGDHVVFDEELTIKKPWGSAYFFKVLAQNEESRVISILFNKQTGEYKFPDANQSIEMYITDYEASLEGKI